MSRADKYAKVEVLAKRAMRAGTARAQDNARAEFVAGCPPSVVLMLIEDLRSAERALAARRTP